MKEEEDLVQQRKKELIKAAEIEQDEQPEPDPAPTNVVSKQRGGMAFAGPLAFRKKNSAKTVKPSSAKRGISKIWEDRPFNNVGSGTSSYDIPKGKDKS